MSRQSESHSDTNECYLMLSKVSHEIRNPVALINSFLQLLVNNHPELKEDSCYLKIEENMDYLKALLDELSTYNHSHTADTEELNPYLLLQNITASAGALLEQQGIDLQLSKESAIPRIPLDRTKFHQLISNLIRNASEAMPDGGTIRIAVSCDGETVSITVQSRFLWRKTDTRTVPSVSFTKSHPESCAAAQTDSGSLSCFDVLILIFMY